MDIHDIALNDTLMENELVVLDNNNKTLFFKRENIVIEMTELQRRFILCLLSGIYKKNDIIRAVWFCNHETISDNNYHQIIFQCRSLLSRHGISGQVIKTIPRFGVMLSFQACERETTEGTGPENKKQVESNKGRKSLLETINYKIALTLTLLFSVAMFVGVSA
ncbi:Uncharacterised protein [Serratia plymuthica]|nr:Uncharacterised protein [Serratia plymuthica]